MTPEQRDEANRYMRTQDYKIALLAGLAALAKAKADADAQTLSVAECNRLFSLPSPR